ncbi:hypothetical protein EUX98_g916 [Antrodiella citrinella]|uniref:Pheromone n=1 Tax=Antrodiella citrinella TaxID=2447956 RepID=A0A4V3XJI6_9APHY|nr:hypothetical protein EUX98_g916 [Antrodiella citrinella]
MDTFQPIEHFCVADTTVAVSSPSTSTSDSPVDLEKESNDVAKFFCVIA